ncbi:unnamed protein product [Dicrocoelium dendriticum]|nr:unnamed protein product [Dicrocoelium dendriticum]
MGYYILYLNLVRLVEEIRKKAALLEREIKNLECYAKGVVERISLEEANRNARLQDESGKNLSELEGRLEELKSSFRNLVDSNNKEERIQRGTLYRLETEIEGIVHKYDQEMTALQSEYDTLDVEYTREKKELSELEERFLTLEEEYTEILEERRIQEMNRQREEAETLALQQSITTIQAFWRSYKTRKAAQARGSGKRKTRR